MIIDLFATANVAVILNMFFSLFMILAAHYFPPFPDLNSNRLAMLVNVTMVWHFMVAVVNQFQGDSPHVIYSLLWTEFVLFVIGLACIYHQRKRFQQEGFYENQDLLLGTGGVGGGVASGDIDGYVSGELHESEEDSGLTDSTVETVPPPPASIATSAANGQSHANEKTKAEMTTGHKTVTNKTSTGTKTKTETGTETESVTEAAMMSSSSTMTGGGGSHYHSGGEDSNSITSGEASTYHQYPYHTHGEEKDGEEESSERDESSHRNQYTTNRQAHNRARGSLIQDDCT